ncbi:MAG: helix-turn-helix domain-containing protein [Candidatus Micrarchaeota archaeon]|nr:helix-turn-helix domain-containing protein [Candidatus Micrarchaeota archaeon]
MELWKKIGFSEGEGKVYEAILRSETPTVQIIHEYTGIERRNVYDIINKLISKGLVSYNLENKKKVYRITHPNKILAYLNEEEEHIEDAKKEVEKELPQLLNIYQSNKEEIHVEIYRGKEGIKTIYEDMLNYKDNYFIGANWGVKKYLGNFWDKWNERRVGRKVTWHDILIPQPLDSSSTPSKKEKLKYYEYKILPQEFNSPHFIVVFGNKVANCIWGEQPFAFVLENRETAKNYMDYFNFLWKQLPSVKK